MDNTALFSDISSLPDSMRQEVADFVGFLQQKLKKTAKKRSGKVRSGDKNTPFKVLHVEMKDYKFNREDANRR